MKSDISGTMKRFSGAMIQPVMFLALIGILLAIVAILRIAFMPQAVIAVGDFLYNLLMNGMISNLSVIFCIGLTCALAKKLRTDAAIIGIVSFLVFLQANNTWLTMTGALAHAKTLAGTGQGMVLGVQVVDMGVFIGIILGCLNAWAFNRFCDVKFTDALRVYGGTRFAFLICITIAAIVGIIACYVWPTVSGALTAIQGFIEKSGFIGLFMYGFLNRILIPTGLHHLVYMPFDYTSVGGVAHIAGQTFEGATPIYMAEIANIGKMSAIDPSSKYLIFGFSKIFGSIGTVLAFIATARPEKKAETKAMLIPAMITAVVAGITEPLEFMYLFLSPLLFLVHSVLDGVFQAILFAIGYHMTLDNLTGIVTSIIIIPAQLSHWYLLIPVGLIAIAIWFFSFRALILKFDLKTPGREELDEERVDLSKMNARGLQQASISKAPAAGAIGACGTAAEIDDSHDIQHIIVGLGGPDNIINILNCFTRLRIDVRDISRIDEEEIKRYKNKGILKGKESVQIIIGMRVQDVCEAVNEALGRTME